MRQAFGLKQALVGATVLGGMVPFAATGAYGASGAQVTVGQAATPSAGAADFPLSVCIDGDLIQADMAAGTISTPLSLAAGDHVVDFIQSEDCSDEPWARGDFNVIDGDNVTLMSWWGNADHGVATLRNDVECIPNGMARISFRNAAAVSSDGPDAPVSFHVTPQGGTESTLFNGLVVGDQNRAEIPVGSYTGMRVTVTGSGSEVANLAAEDFTNGEHQTIYLYGGADGDVGTFSGPPETLPPCDVPSTTTTTAPTTTAPTTTTPPTVRAVAVTPRFTG